MAEIEIRNCRIEDSRRRRIEDFSWRMREGESWLVTGPNGGGKADFVAALSGGMRILPNSDRSVFINDFSGKTEVVSLEVAARLIERERELDESDYMDRLDEGRSARRFLCEVLGGPDERHRHIPLPPIASRLETLPEVRLCGIEKILDRGLRLLSTGEIRRTLLCRALLSRSEFLILSDPFAGLDAQSRGILTEFFQKIAGKTDSAKRILLSMERYADIPKTVTNVLEFSENRVSFCGTKDEYEKILEERKISSLESGIYERAEFSKNLEEIRKSTSVLLNDSHSNNNLSNIPIPKKSLIRMQNVNVGWGENRVIRDFCWEVKEGEHWLIRGPNGSGKTTILELITGDNKQVFSNDVWLFGRKRGTGESIWDIKKNLGIVSYRLHVEYRMVAGTDLEGVIVSGFRDTIGLYENRTEIEVQAARKWLRLAGFEGRESESFGNLSYGEQRAVLILRAAAKCPPLLILDEPCHGLDENFREKILNLLEEIAETGTTTLLHVTHDPTEVLECEKHILELRPNEEVMYGIQNR